MTKQLPSTPNLEHLRNDASCCQTLRNLHQFSDKPDHEILSTETPLSSVQAGRCSPGGNAKGRTRSIVFMSGLCLTWESDTAALISFTGSSAVVNNAYQGAGDRGVSDG